MSEEKKIKRISIPCFKTILQAMDKDDSHHKEAKLFFSTLANERGKSQEYRKHWGYLTAPIFNLLYEEIIFKLYNQFYDASQEKDVKKKEEAQNKIIPILEIVEAVLVGLEMDPFELDIDHRESLFEIAKLLNDEENTEIKIISEDEKVSAVKTKLVGQDQSYDFNVIDLFEWIEETFV